MKFLLLWALFAFGLVGAGGAVDGSVRLWRVAAARRARRRARGPRAPAIRTQPVGRYVADRMVEQIAREYDRRYPLQQVEREAFVVRDHFLNDRRHQAGS